LIKSFADRFMILYVLYFLVGGAVVTTITVLAESTNWDKQSVVIGAVISTILAFALVYANRNGGVVQV